MEGMWDVVSSFEEISQARPQPEPDQAAAAARAMLEALARQTEVTEEIRDQFSEHLELLRQILRLLMAERR